MILAAIALLLLLLTIAHYFGSVRRYRVDVPYALMETLRTPDGARI